MTKPPTRSTTSTTAVIMAAGLGTRMRSRTPKLLHEVCGRPMLAYVIDAAREATGARPLVVYSSHTAALCEVFAGQVDCALQDEPRGTADAVRAALDLLPRDVTEIAVINGDIPLIDPAMIAALIAERRAEMAVVALLTIEAYEPDGLGRVVRDEDDHVMRVVEEKDATEDELDIDEINSGVYAFDVGWLRRRLGDIAPSPVTGELYLPSIVALARADHRPIATVEVEDDGTLYGINDRAQLASAEIDMRLRINERHMLAGVTMLMPNATHIEAGVVLDEDVTLEPNVFLAGVTRIGRGSVITSGSRVVDSVIGERCTITSSVIESSIVEDDVRIGPFSHLRAGTRVESGAEIGNFAEIKKSRLGRGTKQHHFSYIGDAEVGARVNVGAGTITCNYDGSSKHRTVIEDDCFIGSDATLVAPVRIAKGSYIGAGSTISKDTPPGQLTVARARQVSIPRWTPPRKKPAGTK